MQRLLDAGRRLFANRADDDPDDGSSVYASANEMSVSENGEEDDDHNHDDFRTPTGSPRSDWVAQASRTISFPEPSSYQTLQYPSLSSNPPNVANNAPPFTSHPVNFHPTHVPSDDDTTPTKKLAFSSPGAAITPPSENRKRARASDTATGPLQAHKQQKIMIGRGSFHTRPVTPKSGTADYFGDYLQRTPETHVLRQRLPSPESKEYSAAKHKAVSHICKSLEEQKRDKELKAFVRLEQRSSSDTPSRLLLHALITTGLDENQNVLGDDPLSLPRLTAEQRAAWDQTQDELDAIPDAPARSPSARGSGTHGVSKEAKKFVVAIPVVGARTSARDTRRSSIHTALGTISSRSPSVVPSPTAELPVEDEVPTQCDRLDAPSPTRPGVPRMPSNEYRRLAVQSLLERSNSTSPLALPRKPSTPTPRKIQDLSEKSRPPSESPTRKGRVSPVLGDNDEDDEGEGEGEDENAETAELSKFRVSQRESPDLAADDKPNVISEEKQATTASKPEPRNVSPSDDEDIDMCAVEDAETEAVTDKDAPSTAKNNTGNDLATNVVNKAESETNGKDFVEETKDRPSSDDSVKENNGDEPTSKQESAEQTDSSEEGTEDESEYDDDDDALSTSSGENDTDTPAKKRRKRKLQPWELEKDGDIRSGHGGETITTRIVNGKTWYEIKPKPRAEWSSASEPASDLESDEPIHGPEAGNVQVGENAKGSGTDSDSGSEAQSESESEPEAEAESEDADEESDSDQAEEDVQAAPRKTITPTWSAASDRDSHDTGPESNTPSMEEASKRPPPPTVHDTDMRDPDARARTIAARQRRQKELEIWTETYPMEDTKHFYRETALPEYGPPLKPSAVRKQKKEREREARRRRGEQPVAQPHLHARPASRERMTKDQRKAAKRDKLLRRRAKRRTKLNRLPCAAREELAANKEARKRRKHARKAAVRAAAAATSAQQQQQQ